MFRSQTLLRNFPPFTTHSELQYESIIHIYIYILECLAEAEVIISRGMEKEREVEKGIESEDSGKDFHLLHLKAMVKFEKVTCV